ncbi:hypothetical protein HYW41_03975 [Candidatus Daviesbacteria bacterium]|nr:hypothetical protein [Candidatus Daviesbacteria bacterium]
MFIKRLKLLNERIFWILILIILIRVLLVLLPSFRIDMTDWQAWTQRLVQLTPLRFYSPDYFSDYFPGYLYILWFLGLFFKVLFPHLSLFSFGFEIYLKLLTNIFDLATAYYIYKIISRYKKGLGISSAIFYLINPALTFNSSVWGQVDGILTFFLVYSSYCLLELKKIYRFSISFALSSLVKPQGTAIFPIMLTYLITNYRFSKYLSLLIIPLCLMLLSLPFFLKDPIFGLFHLFQKSTSTYPYTSMFSYNFWSFAGWWIPDSHSFLNIPYRTWGIIIYLFFLILILFPLTFKKGYKKNSLVYFAISLAIFAFFLFLTRIHQRYLYPFFAFLLITAFIHNSLRLKAIYIILSLIHFINLWYVYYYYNFVYPNQQFASLFIYQLLNQSYNLFTLLNLIGFGVLLLVYYRSSYSIKNSK